MDAFGCQYRKQVRVVMVIVMVIFLHFKTPVLTYVGARFAGKVLGARFVTAGFHVTKCGVL